MSTSARSFICEHTAEYYLVPALRNILLKKYQTVIPIFPWLSREGTNIAKEIHKDIKFKLVGLYPRRPKLASRNQTTVKIKINHEISLGAKRGYSLGIPMLAGAPCVRSFLELCSAHKYFWVKLGIGEIDSYEIDINNKGVIVDTSSLADTVIKDETELLSFVEGISVFMSWDDAVDAVKQIKADGERVGTGHYRHFLFTSGYKPLYFLLPEET